MNKYLDEIIVFGALALLLISRCDIGVPAAPPFPIVGSAERMDGQLTASPGLVAWDNASRVWFKSGDFSKE